MSSSNIADDLSVLCLKSRGLTERHALELLDEHLGVDGLSEGTLDGSVNPVLIENFGSGHLVSAETDQNLEFTSQKLSFLLDQFTGSIIGSFLSVLFSISLSG